MGFFNLFKKKQKVKKNHSFKPSNEFNTIEDKNNLVSRESINTYKGNVYNTTYSKNGIYKCYFNDISSNNAKKNGEVVLFENNKVLFQKYYDRPNDVVISDNGTIAFCCWLDYNDLSGEFYVLDRFGDKLFKKKLKANLGQCQISNDSKIAVFETYGSDNNQSNKIFVINLENGTSNHINKDFEFNKIRIYDKKILLSNHKMSIAYNLNGDLLIDHKKIKEILEKGDINYVIRFFQKRILDEDFLSTYLIPNYDLLLSLANSKSSFRKGQKIELSKIYRKTGEYFEKNDDYNKAIRLFETALILNDKIGLKRKIELLNKKM